MLNRCGRRTKSLRSRATYAVVAAALALALALGATSGPGPASAASSTFAPGSLIIPMDTDTSANHASFNQNLGMWKAYGLVYRLLQNGIPVRWGINAAKTATTDVDVSVSSVKDLRTGTALGAWSYQGGPFIIDSADASAALPIIGSWWAANGNQPNVHQAQAGFSAEVDVTLRSAPRIATEDVNAGIAIAYYNAAGIPDSNGNPWSTNSPNILDENEIAAGGLFTQGSPCLQRKYDVFVTPHNSGYAYSLTDPTNLGTRTYAQLDTFVDQGGGWTALCHSILSNENAISDLTRNGSPAVKGLFKTSLPGGAPGGLLTQAGFPKIDNTGGTWTVSPSAANLPVAQLVPTTVAQTLPGGLVQTWPSPGNPGAPTYWASTERVAFFDTTGVDHDMILNGTYHDGTGLGKVTFIGGHSFSTSLPYSNNFEAPYLRAFYNSLFFNGSAVAKVDLAYSPAAYPQNGTSPLNVSIVNTGGSVAASVGNVTLTLSPGFTYLSTSFGPSPTVAGNVLTWIGGLGDIAGGERAVTFRLAVDPSVSGTPGEKSFGTFHATYGDVFGEGFTADLCRAISVSPVPAPKLSKTPSTQGPVSTGSPVTWTLTYGNTGAAPLLGGVLEDTLPAGFTYVFSTSSPTLAAPTVIPAPTGTIVRWKVGTVAAGTPSSGRVTITAKAGAVTSGTGRPPQQTFTNDATLAGNDAVGNTYTDSASADVVVQALDVTLGKSVDKTFLGTLPGAVTYTLTPRSDSNDALENVRVIDPFPGGLTPPPTLVGQGGTYGPYVPIPAVPRHDNGPPILDTAMTVGNNFVIQGGTVSVTLNVKSSVAVTNVVPSDLGVTGGNATCTGPTPASANVPAGGAGANFVWSCTLADFGEYVFSADADDVAGTTSWLAAASPSVLSAAGGGPNVVTWNLGSNTPPNAGQTITSGFTGGVYGLGGNDTAVFQKYDVPDAARASAGWSPKAPAPANVAEGGALTTDGVGTIYSLAGNGTQTFWAHDIASNTWAAKTNTGANTGEGGALQFLTVGGTKYVYALMGNSNLFRRYDVAANTWAAMASVPAGVRKGGSLTTDGTNLYALVGGGSKAFYRYNVAANTWTRLDDLPQATGWGTSLTRVGNFLFALEGNGKNKFYRYGIIGDSWTTLDHAPGNVADGGSLTTDGTYLYAFQGKTTAFWRYNIGLDQWSILADYDPAPAQGGALVFVPGADPHGQFTSLLASRSLTVTGDTVTVTVDFTSSAPSSGVTAGALVTTPAGGASCSSLAGPTLTSDDTTTSSESDPVEYQWTCTVAAGANPGSLTFSLSGATGSGPLTFPAATANSVLVSPLLTFTATVPAGTPSPVVDQALLAASGETTSSPPVSTFIGQPALTIVKSNSPASGTTLRPGDPITYTTVVQNTGVGNATNVVVSDPVPANTVFGSCSGGTSCGVAAGTVTWTIGTLAPGDIATVSFTVSTSRTLPVSPTPYTISNTASATSTETPTAAQSNTVTNQLQVKPTIVKSVSATEAQTGDTLTYTLSVSNPGIAFTGDVTDAVPAGTSFAGNCVPACTFAAGTVTWASAIIPAGSSSFSFDVTVTAGGGTTVTNSAILDPSSPDLAPISSNPAVTEIGPDLSIVKLNSPSGPVSAGDTITYTLVLNNESNVTAHGVVVTDPVPVGTSYGTCTTPASTTCGQAGGVVSWQLGDVPGNATVSLTFTVTVGTPPVGTFQITNQAAATATNTSEGALSNFVYNTLPFPSLVLTKTALEPSYAAVGETIHYTYAVTNNSTTSTLAGPITVTDDKVAVSCPAGNLAPLASITCTAAHAVTQADLDAGSITNAATAHAGGTASNTAQVTVPAAQTTSLTLVKSITSGDPYAVAGAAITYGYLVTNTGNVTLHGLAVVDDNVAAAPTCTKAVLAPGESTTCTAIHTVTQADLDAGKVVNHASASALDPGNAPVASNTDTKTARSTQTATVTIVKSSNATPATKVDDTVTFGFLVTNTGNVTITSFTVTDPLPGLSTVDCHGVTSLAPMTSTSCSATYKVTQADIDAGLIRNRATVDGQTATAGPVSDADILSTPLTKSAAVTLVKSSNASPATKVGATITYGFLVTNTGTVTITSFAVTDALPGLSAIGCGGVSSLAPLASVTCTATYTVEQADIDAGVIHNTATVNGQTATAGPVTDDDTLSTPLTKTPAVTIVKSSNATASTKVGDTVTFGFLVTNSGNVTITSFVVTDALVGLSPVDCHGASSLIPKATATCTATYTVTQADVDAGVIHNTATVNGQTATAGPVTDDDTLTTPLSRTPAVTLVKSSNATVATSAGDTITYSFLVTNTGTVTITAFTVSDPLVGLSPIGCGGVSSLPPAASVTCTATYKVTQADVDAGVINNTAVVNGQTATTGPVSDDSTLVTPLAQRPALLLTKHGSVNTAVVAPNGRADAGDRIDYTLRAVNSGNTTLTGVTMSDPKLGTLVCTPVQPAMLLPGEQLACTGSYTLTQADIDAGEVDNTATADSGQTPPTDAPADVSITRVPVLTIVKHDTLDMTVVAPIDRADAGDKIAYTLTATNAGNVTLTGVTVADAKLGALVCAPLQPATLAPGAHIQCTGSYTLTQADVDLGQVNNTGIGDSDQTPPVGAPNEVTLTNEPALSVVKHGALDITASPPVNRANPGDKINYVITATNAGNVTLTGVTVSDPTVGSLVCVPAQPATLLPGAQMACTGTHTLTQADVDRGRVDNTATADSDQTAPVDAPSGVLVPQVETLTLAKQGVVDLTVILPNDRADVGDRVNYTLTATNLGNVTLTGVTVTDPKLGTLICTPVQPTTLAPGDQIGCTGSYTLTQADLNSGHVDNTATADSDQAPPTQTTERVGVPQSPALTLAKTGALDTTVVAPADRADAGDRIAYTLTAANTGNVTLTGVTVSDPKLAVLACTPTQPAVLAPAAHIVCTGNYTLTQADIDAGEVDNTASADSGQTAPTQTPATTPVPQAPELTLAKKGVLDMSVVLPADRADAGDRVTYTLTAANAGNVTLTNVTVSDPKLGPVACTPEQPATLAPGDQIVCTGTHTLTQAEVDSGEVTNTGTGESDQTPPTHTPDTVTLPQTPALTIVKDGVLDSSVVAPGDRVDVGDAIHYTLTATNSGNVTLTGVTVSDPTVGTLDCAPPQPATLEPGEQVVCTGTHTLIQADIDAGKVDNTASADSDQTAAVHTSDTVPLPPATDLTLVKHGTLEAGILAPAGRADPGDRVAYSLTATNAGNVTLSDVTVVDPTLGTLVCAPAAPATLAPGETMTCLGVHTLTQADIDLGHVDNTATANSDLAGPTDTSSTVPLQQTPALTLTKVGALDETVVAPSDRPDVGDRVDYTLTATNAGNVTLTNVILSDPKLGALACLPPQPATLAPGAQLACTGSYTLTQADLDLGRVDNTATADSDQTGPAQRPSTVPLPQLPALTLAKHGTLDTTVSLSNVRADSGDTIAYTLAATNTGNVTLTGVTVSDPKLGTLACSPTQPATLAPGEYIVCTGSYTLTQADVNTGRVDNVATAGSDQGASARAPASVPVPQAPGLTLDKRGTLDPTVVAPGNRADPGDEVTYALTAVNTGNVTLSGVTVTDAKLGALACIPAQPTSLPPDGRIVCTGSYTLTQADVDGGHVDNTATAESSQTAPVQTPSTVEIPQAPALTLDKNGTLDTTVVPPISRADAGDRIDYTLTASNAGNVTLTGVTITDPKLGTLACAPTQPATLLPGEQIVCTGSYTLTQADVDGGAVDNTATADSDQSTPIDAPSEVAVAQVPALTLVKHDTLDMTVVAPATRADAGDRVDYTLTATNAGNVTLTGATLADPKLGPIVCAPTQPAALLPGEQIECAGSHTLTQADVDSGLVDNTATADSDQTAPTDTPNEASLTREPALTLDKEGILDMTVVPPGTRPDVGDRIDYTLVATNAGNVTLTGVTVSDPTIGALVCAPLQPATLLPGEQIVCTGSHILTQADLNNGGVDNTATADSSESAPVEAVDPVPLPPAPGLSLLKQAVESSYSHAGDVVHYRYVVVNTGTVSLAGPVTVSDNRTSVTCPATSTVGNGDGFLDPRETLTCTASYTVTQADLDAGKVTNTATASAAGTTSNTSSTTVTAVQVRALNLVKSASPTSFDGAGTVVKYSYVVTNTGNVTLAGPITVTDDLTTVTCPVGSLAPGASITCTSSYTVTQANVNAGSVTNHATAHASVVGSNQAQVTVGQSQPPEPTPNPTPPNPTPPTTHSSILITKSPAKQKIDAGATATFKITVSNDGTATLQNVSVADPLTPGCSRTSATIAALGSLPPGASVTYTCTSANVKNSFTNVATATGSDPGGQQVKATSSASVTVVPAQPPPPSTVAIVKGPASQSIGHDGVAHFTITVKNTGQVPALHVTVVDPHSPDCNSHFARLEVGQVVSYECSRSHVTAGFQNVAVVTWNRGHGQGHVLGSRKVIIHVAPPAPPQHPGISIVKGPSVQTASHDRAHFTITVRNTGNATLHGVEVLDPMSPQCTKAVGTLTRGRTVTYSCIREHVAASFTNTATATGTSPAGKRVKASDSARVKAKAHPKFLG